MNNRGATIRGRLKKLDTHALIVFAVLFISYAYFFQGGGWNPNSRLNLTRALVEGPSIRIDAYLGNTGDWSKREGHFYTNKAPGLSLISAPVFYSVAKLQKLITDASDQALLISAYLTNVVVNGIPSALLGVLLYYVMKRLGIQSASMRAWLSITFGLGTLAFPYATSYYAHQLAAVLGFAAFASLLVARGNPSKRVHSVLAGLAAGGAVLVESSTVLIVVVLALVTLSDQQGRRLFFPFVLGGLPMAAIFALYNLAAFGHPLASSYTYANPAVMFDEGGSIFGMPRPDRMADLLLLPYRGLWFTSPLLLLAPAGWHILRRKDSPSAWICLAVPLAFVLLISSFHGWAGGWAPGPRYLIPCLPFLFVLGAFVMARLRWVSSILAGVSMAIMLSITLVAVEIPHNFKNPVFDFVLPHLKMGRVSVNPQGLDEFMPPSEYMFLQAPDNWNSFNLGELIWPHSLLSVLPLLALWLVSGVLLLYGARKKAAHPR